MPINYVGPATLKNVFEDEYARVSSNYDRRDPNIVVGIPNLPKKAVSLKDLGFGTQERFNIFVDQIIKKILAGLREFPSIGESNPEVVRLLSNLRRASFISNKSGQLAGYMSLEDMLIFDAYQTVLYMNGLGKNLSSNIPVLLYHELVHNDIGICTPYVEARRHHIESGEMLGQFRKALAAAENESKAKKWREEEGGNEFLEEMERRLGSCDPDTIQKEIGRLNRLVNDIKTRMKKLNLVAAEEALAYNYESLAGINTRNKTRFLFYLRSNLGYTDLTTFSLLYENLERRLQLHGGLPILRELGIAVNTAWMEGQDITDLLL